MKDWIVPIKKMRACEEALKWAESLDSLEDAWAECQRGDWMLWLLARSVGGSRSQSRKRFVLAACQCARLALPYVLKDDIRPLKAIETAEAWARGEATISAVREAARAAAYAADAANAADAADAAARAAAYAADAAYAAAFAAYAADYAAYAAAYAAYAADYAANAAARAADAAAFADYAADAADAAGAADAADYAANADARAAYQGKCAGIVRRLFPHAPTMRKGGEK